MQRILEYVEATLDADITPRELADFAGYSLWHFLHLFREAVGMPLNRYRTRRRLCHAIWQVHRGMSVTDAALRWGFGSHSGFWRAFTQEYGCSPTAYLRTVRVREPKVPLLKEEKRMLHRDLFREALTHWDVDAPLTPVIYPDSGQMSDTALYVGRNLTLKACRDERACRLALMMADALRAQGVPAAETLPLPDGRMSLPLSGVHFTLCRRVPGQPLRASELLADPENAGRRIGAALAKLHLALAHLDDLPCADDLDLAAHLTGWALPAAKDALPAHFPADFAARAEDLRHLPRTLIHRDPNPGNLLDCGDNISFVDFDLSVRCVRLFDPCYTATAVLSETFLREDVDWAHAWPVFIRSLLAGYNGVSPLTEAEWQAVPTLLLGNELLCLAAFADSRRYQDVFETNRQMLAWMLDHLPQ